MTGKDFRNNTVFLEIPLLSHDFIARFWLLTRCCRRWSWTSWRLFTGVYSRHLFASANSNTGMLVFRDAVWDVVPIFTMESYPRFERFRFKRFRFVRFRFKRYRIVRFHFK